MGVEVVHQPEAKEARGGEMYASAQKRFEMATQMQRDIIQKQDIARMAREASFMNSAKQNISKMNFTGQKIPSTNNEHLSDMGLTIEGLLERGKELQESLKDKQEEGERDPFPQAFRDFSGEVDRARAQLNGISTTMISSPEDQAAKANLSALLTSLENLTPKGMYVKPTEEFAGEKQSRENVVNITRLLLATAGAMYTAYSLYSGYETGNYLPAVIGGVATGLLIFGPKLLEGKAEGTARQLAYLEQPEYKTFFQKYGMTKAQGSFFESQSPSKDWSNFVQNLQGDSGRLNEAFEESKGKSKEDIRKIAAELGAPPSLQTALVSILQNQNDFALLRRICTDGDPETVAKFIENGCPTEAIDLARNPRKAFAS